MHLRQRWNINGGGVSVLASTHCSSMGFRESSLMRAQSRGLCTAGRRPPSVCKNICMSYGIVCVVFHGYVSRKNIGGSTHCTAYWQRSILPGWPCSIETSQVVRRVVAARAARVWCSCCNTCLLCLADPSTQPESILSYLGHYMSKCCG